MNLRPKDGTVLRMKTRVSYVLQAKLRQGIELNFK
ncbi:hypothetical protein QUC31_007606 [Theobroma cacao]